MTREPLIRLEDEGVAIDDIFISDDESSILTSASSSSVLFDPAQLNAHRAQLASLKPRRAVIDAERAAASFRGTTHVEYVRELERNVAVVFSKRLEHADESQLGVDNVEGMMAAARSFEGAGEVREGYPLPPQVLLETFRQKAIDHVAQATKQYKTAREARTGAQTRVVEQSKYGRMIWEGDFIRLTKSEDQQKTYPIGRARLYIPASASAMGVRLRLPPTLTYDLTSKLSETADKYLRPEPAPYFQAVTMNMLMVPCPELGIQPGWVGFEDHISRYLVGNEHASNPKVPVVAIGAQDSRFKAWPNPSPHSAKLHCVPLTALEASPAPPLQEEEGVGPTLRSWFAHPRAPNALFVVAQIQTPLFEDPTSEEANRFLRYHEIAERERRGNVVAPPPPPLPPGAVRPEPRRTGSETSLNSSNGPAFPELPKHVPNRASGPSPPPVRANTRDPRLRVATASGGSHSNVSFAGVRFDNSPVSATTDSPRSYREHSPSHEQQHHDPRPTRTDAHPVPITAPTSGSGTISHSGAPIPRPHRKKSIVQIHQEGLRATGSDPSAKVKDQPPPPPPPRPTWKAATGLDPAAYRPPSDVDTSMLVPLGQGAVPGMLNDALMRKGAAGGSGSGSGTR